jgi:hypothetical protein
MKLKYEKNYTDGSYKAVVETLRNNVELVICIRPKLTGGDRYYDASLEIQASSDNVYVVENEFAGGWTLKEVKSSVDENLKLFICDFAFKLLDKNDQIAVDRHLGFDQEVA